MKLEALSGRARITVGARGAMLEGIRWGGGGARRFGAKQLPATSQPLHGVIGKMRMTRAMQPRLFRGSTGGSTAEGDPDSRGGLRLFFP